MRLQREGFEVIVAENGLEAVKLAKSELPDLILMDMGPPRRKFALTIPHGIFLSSRSPTTTEKSRSAAASRSAVTRYSQNRFPFRA